MLKLAGTYELLVKSAQIYSNLLKSAQIYSNLHKSAQICLFRIGPCYLVEMPVELHFSMIHMFWFHSEYGCRIWRIDVGMSTGVLDSMPEVYFPVLWCLLFVNLVLKLIALIDHIYARELVFHFQLSFRPCARSWK